MTPKRSDVSPRADREALARLRERKRFIHLTRADEKLLAGLRPAFTAQADAIVEQFYQHLLGFEELRPLLADPALVIRLKEAQKRYLISLTDGTYGKRYLENRLRIGRVHEQVGLLPQWFMGTYGFYIDLLRPIVSRQCKGALKKTMHASDALAKLMNLDAQIVLEVYFEARQQKAVGRSERLAAVGELAASIAHEVRNPLAGMKGALQILRRDMDDDPARLEVMDEVVAQIERLETLVRDLLTYAQPRPLDRHPVDLHELLDRVLRFLQEGFEPDGIRIRREYAPEITSIFADPQQLEQVFLNLIDNAVHAMEKGGTLTLASHSADGRIAVSFSDTGKGIPAANLRRIFKPFFTTKHRGSGLGLSIVQKIVEAHGGSLRVESNPDQGTKVTILLPRREPVDGA